MMAPVPSVRSTATPSGRDPPHASVTRDTSVLKRTQHPCPAPVSTPGLHIVQCFFTLHDCMTDFFHSDCDLMSFVSGLRYFPKQAAVFYISNKILLWKRTHKQT